MTSAVGDHGVAQAVFAVKPTEKESEPAVEKETTEDYDGSRTDHQNRRGQMSCGEK